jgi:hypothetical protein
MCGGRRNHHTGVIPVDPSRRRCSYAFHMAPVRETASGWKYHMPYTTSRFGHLRRGRWCGAAVRAGIEVCGGQVRKFTRMAHPCLFRPWPAKFIGSNWWCRQRIWSGIQHMDRSGLPTKPAKVRSVTTINHGKAGGSRSTPAKAQRQRESWVASIQPESMRVSRSGTSTARCWLVSRCSTTLCRATASAISSRNVVPA